MTWTTGTSLKASGGLPLRAPAPGLAAVAVAVARAGAGGGGHQGKPSPVATGRAAHARRVRPNTPRHRLFFLLRLNKTGHLFSRQDRLLRRRYGR